MDYRNYEKYDFDKNSAFNMSTGYSQRTYKRHWHSYGEIMLVGPGKTNVYKVGRNTYELSPGDLVLIWPMEMHETLDADRKEALVIQFSNGFMNSLFDLQRIMHFYRNIHVICTNTHPELAAKLQTIANKMKDIFFSESRDRELRCCMLLMEFMLTLDDYRSEFAPELRITGRDNYTEDIMRRMISVIDYIKTNLTADDLSQAAMAQRVGVSKDYFSRIFKSVTGMNYNKWLNMIRIEKAIQLIAEDDCSLTEVAMLSGFQSIPSFNRVFRSEKGMSPGEYRALLVRGL